MRAIVLSGGGNRGALQVGALRALVEQGIVPDLIIGCSVGALNAALIAREFSLAQTGKLLSIWKQTSKADVYPGGRAQILWRILSGKDSFYDNSHFYAHLQRHGTDPALTFGDRSHRIPLLITATHLESEQMYVFGSNPNDRVLDALMASTALPPVHPPWTVDGKRYIDGGTVTPLPLRVAIERGATEIYALHIWDEPKTSDQLARGVSAIINRSISTMLRLQAEHDLLLTEVAKKPRLHNIRLWTEDMPDINDWSQSERLHTAGYRTTQKYLSAYVSRQGRLTAQEVPMFRRFSKTIARGLQNLTGQPAVHGGPVPVADK